VEKANLYCLPDELCLNATKTKDMCIDFRKDSPTQTDIVIHDNKIEVVDNTHILHEEYTILPSSRRVRTVTSKTNKKLLSSIPLSARLFNEKNLSFRESESQASCLLLVCYGENYQPS